MLEEDLTRAEKLRLHRWRQCLSRSQAARALGVDLAVYALCEKGELDGIDVGLGGISQNERFVVYRFREGLTPADIARKMGCSRGKIDAAERARAPLAVLKEFWGEK